MAEVVYIACAVMSIACAVLLCGQYRRAPSAVLLWSSLAFVILAAANIFLVVDLVILRELDMAGPLLRNLMTMASGLLLLFGLIMELT